MNGVIEGVCKNCKIGDIYLLYRIKGHLSHARFYELLFRLSSPTLFPKPASQTGAPELTQIIDKDPKQQVPDSLRQRGGQTPQLNQNYYNQLLPNPAALMRPGMPQAMMPGMPAGHPGMQHLMA